MANLISSKQIQGVVTASKVSGEFEQVVHPTSQVH